MEGDSKKDGLLTFVLFNLKWLEIKNSNEIEKQKVKKIIFLRKIL